MWGPCREVALQRQSDERLAGYDPQTVEVALSRTYSDCVSGDRRVRVHSIYDNPAPAAPLPAARPVPAGGAIRSTLLPIKPQE